MPFTSQSVRTSFSQDEMAIRTILGEESMSDPTGQLAVADVINNRANSPQFGWSNISQPSQFNGFNSTISSSSPAYQQAAQAWDLAKSGVDITGGATFYANPSIAQASWPQAAVAGGGMMIGQQVYSDQLGAPSPSYAGLNQSLDATAPLGNYAGGSAGIAANGNVNYADYPNMEGTYSGETQTQQQQAGGQYSLGSSSNYEDYLRDADAVNPNTETGQSAITQPNQQYTLGFNAADAASNTPGDSSDNSYDYSWPVADPPDYSSMLAQPSNSGGGESSSGSSGGVTGEIYQDPTDSNDQATTPGPSSGTPAEWDTYGVPATIQSGQTIAAGVGNAITGAANAVDQTTSATSSSWLASIADWFMRAGVIVVGLVLISAALWWIMRSAPSQVVNSRA